MITAVDTNVLIDVLTADTRFGEASREAVRGCRAEGKLVACDVVWAEVAGGFSASADAERAMTLLGVGFSSLDAEAALLAGYSWRAYRRSGGARERVIADFLIGAHALASAEGLLTRDRGFYRRYFEELRLLDPARLEA